MNNLLPQYDEYHIQNVIDRLENLRCSIGYGQLNDDLRDAIDCLKYVEKAIKLDREASASKETKTPHLIIFDYGFAGQYYKCSECDRGGWDVPKGTVHECPHCHVTLDPNAIEYKF